MAEQATSPEFEHLVDYLRDNRGFDFTGYKRGSLKRRIDRRMQAVGVESYPAYRDFLEVHPDEFTALFNTILINVTEFFRNMETWAYLRDEGLPRLLEAKGPDETLRVWSAGCASGEEPYSVAMLLAEILGPETVADRAKIYATDVDEEALEQARRAVYSEKALEQVPQELRDRYFTANPNGEGRAFRADVRRAVIFGRHDLVKDAPISHTDLLLCRNTLMYFNVETQRRILTRLNFALNDPGLLVLGQVEMLLGSRDLFKAVEGTHRVFVKLGPSHLCQRLEGIADHSEMAVAELDSTTRFADEAFEQGPVPQVVVDATDLLASANRRARQLFELHDSDLQRPFQDLAMSYRPVEVRSLIEQARAERGLAALRDVEWHLPDGETCHYEFEVFPLGDAGEVLLTVFDVTSYRALRQELESSNRELEEAYEELQSTNEELETTNEELQSTNEELETTNEELQSTVEELETTNEELQSTNEQLHAINHELEARTQELNDVNAFLEAIISSFEGAVIVLDTELNVQVWSDYVVDLWGLRPDEVEGRSFFGLDIGLPTEELAPVVRGCVKGAAERERLTLTATDRRGRTFECGVSCMPLKGTDESVRGAIVVVEPHGDPAWRGGDE